MSDTCRPRVRFASGFQKCPWKIRPPRERPPAHEGRADGRRVRAARGGRERSEDLPPRPTRASVQPGKALRPTAPRAVSRGAGRLVAIPASPYPIGLHMSRNRDGHEHSIEYSITHPPASESTERAEYGWVDALMMQEQAELPTHSLGVAMHVWLPRSPAKHPPGMTSQYCVAASHVVAPQVIRAVPNVAAPRVGQDLLRDAGASLARRDPAGRARPG